MESAMLLFNRGVAKCWGDSRTTDILAGCLVSGSWFLNAPGGTKLGEGTIQIRTVGLVQNRDSGKKEF